MYNNPYFIPRYHQPFITPPLARTMTTNITPSLAQNIPNMLNNTRRASGLFQKLGTSLSGIKKINWGNLINNTSKTLGIINQTIPVVRQVGPMFNNMKQMVRVASLFKDETDIKNTNYSNKITKNTNTTITQNNTKIKPEQVYTSTKEDIDVSPTFFINT